MGDPLLIVGASGRAAAASALRAGFKPFVIDLFGDADTVRLCPTLKCDPATYPHGFVELAKQAPPGPWMYTGGLENHPDVVAEISEERELWGNGPEVLKLVRDPFWLANQLDATGLKCPRISLEPLPTRRSVRKPFAGSAGRGIRFAVCEDSPDPLHYFQEWVDGQPRSAVFTSDGVDCCFDAEFVQLVGTPWLHAGQFQYAGNVGPLSQSGGDLRRVKLIECGARLTHVAGLRGVWGFDFIESDRGSQLLEVNPRFPASVELAMWSRGVQPLLAHADCFRSSGSLVKRKYWMQWPTVVGKAIYYAAAPITFPASGPWDDSLARCTDVWRMPEFADIPHPGTLIEPGQPVFTLFASAPTEAECVHQLKGRAADCDRLFGVPTPEDAP